MSVLSYPCPRTTSGGKHKMPIKAKTARYIAVDDNEEIVGALEFGEIRLSCRDVPDELARQGNISKITRYLVQLGYAPEAAAGEAGKAKDFYSLGGDCLWITFARGRLWWTFADPQVIWITNDFVMTGERVRKSIGGWCSTDANGVPLRTEGLSKGIVALQAGEEPKASTLRELLQLINGAAKPAAKNSAQVAGTDDTAGQGNKTLNTASRAARTQKISRVGKVCGLVAFFGLALCVGDAVAQKAANWKRVEADNGAVYQIDLNSISRYNNGTADIVVYAVEGSSYNPEHMHRLWFDCHGRFRDETGPSFGTMQSAPPRSMAGRISEIACAGAKDTRLEEPSRPEPKDTPAQYCVGFSPEACARITAAAEAKSKPSYCKPGFGLYGSGLSPEQSRICSVISNEEDRIASNQTKRLPAQIRNKYDLSLSASRSNFPYIVGLTSLPDGTKLLVSINKPRLPNARELLAAGLPMCEDDCIPASGPKGEVLGVSAVVQSGAFSAGPFSWSGKPFRQGTFDVDIFLVSIPGEDATRPDTVNMQIDRMKKPIRTIAVTIRPQQ